MLSIPPLAIQTQRNKALKHHPAYSRLVLLIILLSPYPCLAQLKLERVTNIVTLVKDKFMGDGIAVHNIIFRGPPRALASYESDSAPPGFITKGILLCTGNSANAPGPNRKANQGTDVLGPGDDDLNNMCGAKTFDAVSLEFDFEPQSDTVAFNYIFASEEYPEFVGTPFNDVFALLISGPGIKGKKNIALLPTTDIMVSINNVNEGRNGQYFIANYLKAKGPYYKFLEYDGLTTKLSAQCNVSHGKTYHLKIVIADMNDRLFDSGVFLEAHSFRSYGVANSNSSLQTGFLKDYTAITPDKGKTRTINLHIQFATDAHEIPDEYFADLDNLAAYLKKQEDISLKIIGHTDSIGSKEHNQQLSEKRAKALANYLIKKGIAKERLSCKGLGDSKPASSNSTEKGRAINRRVELVFRRE